MIDHKFLDQSTAWLAEGVSRSLTRPISAGLGDRPRILKALCEISFLEYDVTAVPSPTLRETIGPILKQQILTPSFLSLFYHNIVHANLFLPLALAAVRANEVPPHYLYDFSTLTGIALRHTKERLPFRMLDLLHGAYRLSGDKRYLNQMIDIGRFGCLGGLTDPLDSSASDNYAVTHTVFYLTDFGRLPWPEAVCDSGIVIKVLDHLSTPAEREGNCDLVGEYLLCRLMLGQRDRVMEEQVDYLQERAVDGTYWKGPADLGDALKKDGISEKEMEFHENYHTTLVVLEALKRSLYEPVHKPPPPLLFTPHTPNRLSGYSSIEQEGCTSSSGAILLNAYKALMAGNLDSFFDQQSELLNDSAQILDAVEYTYFASRVNTIPESWRKKMSELTAAYTPKMHENSRFVRLLVLADGIVGGLDSIPLNRIKNDAEVATAAYRRNPDTILGAMLDRLVVLAVLLKKRGNSGTDDPSIAALLSQALILLYTEQAWHEFATLLAHSIILFDERLKNRFLDLVALMQPRSAAPGWLDPQTNEEKDFADRLSVALYQVFLASL